MIFSRVNYGGYNSTIHMPLSAGMRLGQYEVVDTLGVGGMGEVYRARDTRLQRDVALKILPDAFSTDPERLARFVKAIPAAIRSTSSGIL